MGCGLPAGEQLAVRMRAAAGAGCSSVLCACGVWRLGVRACAHAAAGRAAWARTELGDPCGQARVDQRPLSAWAAAAGHSKLWGAVIESAHVSRRADVQ